MPAKLLSSSRPDLLELKQNRARVAKIWRFEMQQLHKSVFLCSNWWRR